MPGPGIQLRGSLPPRGFPHLGTTPTQRRGRPPPPARRREPAGPAADDDFDDGRRPWEQPRRWASGCVRLRRQGPPPGPQPRLAPGPRPAPGRGCAAAAARILCAGFGGSKGPPSWSCSFTASNCPSPFMRSRKGQRLHLGLPLQHDNARAARPARPRAWPSGNGVSLRFTPARAQATRYRRWPPRWRTCVALDPPAFSRWPAEQPGGQVEASLGEEG